MIPLRDVNPLYRKPVVVYCIIAANTAVWLYQASLGPQLFEDFVRLYGATPAFLSQGEGLLTAATSMFMHGGWLHFLSNMWFLYVFGDNIEDVLGHARFVVFYIACGVLAVVLQVVVSPDSIVPMVGASGAIAGVLGAYVLKFPRARILTLVPIFIFIQLVEVPAFIFLFVWFGLQLLGGFGSLAHLSVGGGGVAYFAHIGGFVAGVVIFKMLFIHPPDKPDRPARSRYVPRDRNKSKRARAVWGRDRHGPS